MPRSLLCVPVMLLAASSCDNVGRAFDQGGGGGSESGDKTNIQAMVAGGDANGNRPTVKSVYPKGGGWPGTVPIVVLFSESMNQDSISPPSNSGLQPNLYVRAKGTTQVLPAQYDFLLGGTAVVIRPLTALTGGGGGSGQAVSYEVAMKTDVRDADGARVAGNAEAVLAEFTPDQDVTKVKDGQILTTLPETNRSNIQRETIVYAVFTKPATTSSVTTTNFVVRPRGGSPVTGLLGFPLASATANDGRVLRFVPRDPLPGETQIDIEVQNTIAFGDGKLDFKNKTPYATFTTLPHEEVQSVRVGNAVTGFPDKVNLANHDNLQIDVALPATTLVDDSVTVRLYGLDPKTKNTSDINFVERAARVPANGAQTLTVDFGGALGTTSAPRFSDGTITLAAQLSRGSRKSGFVLAPAANRPSLDLTPPSLTSLGPPVGAATDEVVTDQEDLVLSGRASERIAEANLSAGAGTAGIFAAAADGRFVLKPYALGRRTSPLGFQLSLRDAAGNFATATATGTIAQRGVVTGSVAGGTLVVEAYDDATLKVAADVTVLIEPGLPQKPASGRQIGTTGADGRVTFNGLTQSSYTVTLLKNGYHLKTLLATPAGFVSLPLVPATTAAATATLAGSAIYVPTPGTSALVGSNLLDDVASENIATTTTNPTLMPRAPIRPNRLQALSAFAGSFEPTQVTTYSYFACQLCGTDGVTLTPPPAPPAPGETLTQTLALLTASGTTVNLLNTYPVDFSLAAGLDTANLVAKPTVRIVSSLRGYPGMTLSGVGFANLSAGSTYTVNGTYSLVMALNLASCGPVFWVSAEAKDTGGNLTRHRRLILDTNLGLTYSTGAPLGIPTITAPAGATAGSPSVTYQDRLDPAQILGGFTFLDLVAVDGAGRRWSVLRQDTDAALGGVTVQLPDLAGFTGLAPGSWSIRADAYLLFSSSFTNGDYVLEEMRRQQVMFARAAAKTFTVN